MSGGKGNSRANTSSASTTTITESTTNNVDNRIFNQSVDAGALDTARIISADALGTLDSISADALGVARSGFQEGADLAGQGLDNALDATRGALAFGESALNANNQATRDALAFGGDAIAELSGGFRTSVQEIADFGGVAIDAVGEAQKGVLQFASDIFSTAIGAQQELTESNIGGLTSLAKQTSESADDRVTRVVGYMALAIAAVFVLPAIFKGGKFA